MTSAHAQRNRPGLSFTSIPLLLGMLLVALVAHDRPACAQDDERSLFENVVNALETKYYDKEFVQERLPAIVERYRKLAYDARTLREQREVTQAMLSNLPASHMGLLSMTSHERLLGELQNEVVPTFGFELSEYDDKHYAQNVYEGGPAERAGLRQGDRILMIDGTPVDDHPRLDWRTDDAYLPDPPIRSLLCEEGDVITLLVEPSWGELREIEIPAADYSAFEAARASARVIEQDGLRIGYIHFWLIHMTGVAPLIKEKLNGEFADCDALVLDLRGRGGSGGTIPGMLRALQGEGSNWRNPIVALINRHSRSAKEVIAYELRRQSIARLVGERTAGAVIPASFEDVGHDTVLMFPTFRLGKHTEHLEGIGVEPDVQMEDARPYSGGVDPVLNAGLIEAARLASEQTGPTRTRTAAAGPDRNGKTAPTLKELAPGEILARMVMAQGGEAAIRSHTSQTLTGTIDFSGMMQGSLTVMASAPNLYLSRFKLEGMGAFTSGYDGAVAWRDDPQRGAGIMDGLELEEMVEQADFFANLNIELRFETIVLAGTEEFGGRQCYRLDLTNDSGRTRSMFIDPTTFLEAGSKVMRSSPMGGEVEIVLTILEYETVDGVKMPTKFRQVTGDIQELTVQIDEISFDPIDPSAFELPDKIKALVDSDS